MKFLIIDNYDSFVYNLAQCCIEHERIFPSTKETGSKTPLLAHHEG